MNTGDLIFFRILHIVFGMVWAGGAVYMTFVLVPKLEGLGPAIQRPVMAAISNVTAAVLTARSLSN